VFIQHFDSGGGDVADSQKKLKILFFDVETCPVLAWIWRTGYKLSISHDQIKKGQRFNIICICWKWYKEKEVFSLDWGIHKQNSTKMIQAFTKEIEKADVVVAHNGDRFDIKQINTQRLLNHQAPIAWPTSEDTLKQVKKYFAFPSYKLDYLAKVLGSTGKDQMCFQDWIDIVEGKKEPALAKMIKYCKKDVILLEKVFKSVEPFAKPKLNAGVAMGTGRYACPRCGSTKSRSNGRHITMTNQYQKRLCVECGHVFPGPRLEYAIKG
jgi:DNA polymerase elongation subunit (family B)/predicted RNA-binding Zn-ribbon protein involved in translation (DUF1610 family)